MKSAGAAATLSDAWQLLVARGRSLRRKYRRDIAQTEMSEQVSCSCRAAAYKTHSLGFDPAPFYFPGASLGGPMNELFEQILAQLKEANEHIDWIREDIYSEGGDIKDLVIDETKKLRGRHSVFEILDALWRRGSETGSLAAIDRGH
jgi:hypothetical protein